MNVSLFLYSNIINMCSSQVWNNRADETAIFESHRKFETRVYINIHSSISQQYFSVFILNISFIVLVEKVAFTVYTQCYREIFDKNEQ